MGRLRVQREALLTGGNQQGSKIGEDGLEATRGCLQRQLFRCNKPNLSGFCLSTILASDRRLVEQAEPQVKALFQRLTGAVDVSSSRDPGKPELRLVVDRKQASDQGVSPGAVASVVRPLVDGVELSKLEVVTKPLVLCTYGA